MSERYCGKFRNDSPRMHNWNYSQGTFFVTIVTKNRQPYFGEIIDGEMHLSILGKIVNAEWLKTVSIRPDMHITLDEFEIMPDHFHGIIGFRQGGDPCHQDVTIRVGFNRRDAMHCVPTIKTTKTIATNVKNKFGPQSKYLASIIRGFKSSVTTQARKLGLVFDWQPRYHEHAIRDDMELKRIVEYIRNNPTNY